jgi:hypothetical protein
MVILSRQVNGLDRPDDLSDMNFCLKREPFSAEAGAWDFSLTSFFLRNHRAKSSYCLKQHKLFR